MRSRPWEPNLQNVASPERDRAVVRALATSADPSIVEALAFLFERQDRRERARAVECLGLDLDLDLAELERRLIEEVDR